MASKLPRYIKIAVEKRNGKQLYTAVYNMNHFQSIRYYPGDKEEQGTVTFHYNNDSYLTINEPSTTKRWRRFIDQYPVTYATFLDECEKIYGPEPVVDKKPDIKPEPVADKKADIKPEQVIKIDPVDNKKPEPEHKFPRWRA